MNRADSAVKDPVSGRAGTRSGRGVRRPGIEDPEALLLSLFARGQKTPFVSDKTDGLPADHWHTVIVHSFPHHGGKCVQVLCDELFSRFQTSFEEFFSEELTQLFQVFLD